MNSIVATSVKLSNDSRCRIEILHVPTDAETAFCRLCALGTVGKDSDKVPTDKWLHDLCKARHSPIRELRFAYRFENLPYFVSTHLARHIHAQPYIQSQRNDRQDNYDRRKAPQDAPVMMIWTMNAEELMTIANKRLCNTADPDTRAIINHMCTITLMLAPWLNGLLVPMCEHLGRCPEMHGCGRYSNAD